MAELSEMLAKSTEWKLGGRTFNVAPLTLNHLAQFEKWIKDNWIADRMKLADHLEGETKSNFIFKFMEQIPVGDTLTYLSTESVGTMEGSQYILYLLIKTNHHDITQEEIFNLISSENFNYIQKIIDVMAGFKKTGSEKKKETNRPKKNKKNE